MVKEFKIKDILSAIDDISKIQKRKTKIQKKNDSIDIEDIVPLNKQVKSNKSDILVLDQMIE